jgi:hypothetical protein
MASTLKMSDVVDLLKQNLEEEEKAAKKVLAVRPGHSDAVSSTPR